MYRGLTGGSADWQTANRADIWKSQELQAFDAMLKQRSTEYSDQLIAHLTKAFDKIFELYSKKIQSTLPGFERKAPDRKQLGLLIPDYNVGVYRTAHKTQIGPSGLITPYFFDVRIEADEEESLQEENLKIIELFLKRIDQESVIEKIRTRLEVIVQNDAIKNIIPNFKEGVPAPEIDPATGKVTSPEERAEKEASSTKSFIQSRVAARNEPESQLSEHKVIFDNWRNFLNEEKKKDSNQSVKAVLHKDGKCLLLKNKMGWDLPGGHIQVNEAEVDALRREVEEETGLSIKNPQDMNMSHNRKKFFSAQCPSDKIKLSDEHSDSGFFGPEEIQKMQVSSPFKKAIFAILKT